MKPMQVATEALKTTWKNKSLWAFGVIIGATGLGGSGRVAQGKPHLDHAAAANLPSWVPLAIAVALVFLVVMVIIHTVCEIALIDGVRRSRLSQPVTFRGGLSPGWAALGRLVRVKLLGTAAMVGCALVVAAPALLHVVGVLPKTAMLISLVPLLVAAVPVLLSIFFINSYALRICVLESKNAIESFRAARAYLSGRVLDSLNLILVSAAGSVGALALSVAAVLPGAMVGALAYLAFGLIPAVIIGGLVALPLVTVVLGATGTFGSAVWTIGYLEGRAEEAV